MQLKLDIVAGKGFGFKECFCLFLGFGLDEGVFLACAWVDVEFSGVGYEFHALSDFEYWLLGYV